MNIDLEMNLREALAAMPSIDRQINAVAWFASTGRYSGIVEKQIARLNQDQLIEACQICTLQDQGEIARQVAAYAKSLS